MLNEEKKPKSNAEVAGRRGFTLLCVFSELMWFVRRAPVLLLMFITWYALGVSSDKNQMLMAVSAYGYFAVHHYLKWIENKYEN